VEPRESRDLSGAILDGRYRVIEPVGQGAMGMVYRAERLKLGRIVAIKILHDALPSELSSRKRFEIEAMAMAKLEHPHCAAVLDVGMHEDKPYVVMDFVSGQDLKTVIGNGPMSVARASEIMRQVLSGLAHAHELGIIHRDIKPANVILSQKAGLGDHVKILDFGLARIAESQTSKLTSGVVVGTPAYMAPEQIRGTVIDGRADLYACGVLLFELVTGKKPFHSAKDDPMEIVSLHLKAPIPRLDQLAPGTDFGELEAIVARALAKSADDRYQSATEFVAALDAGRSMPHQAPVLVPPEPPGPVAEPSLSIPQAPSAPGTRLGIAVAPPGAPVPTGLPTQATGYQAALPPPGPRPARRNPTELPFTRRQLAIGGGGLLVVLLCIAVIANRGNARSTTASDAALAAGSGDHTQPPGDPAGAILTRATDLMANGEREAAIDLLSKSRTSYPTNAEIPYLAGKLYFAKLWWTDGLRSFRDAIRLDPRFRTDPELIKIALKGFITTPSYNDEIANFLRNDIGAVAQPFLEETSRDHPNAAVRARATAELRRYR
jgi:serine/threonine protein kinase